MAITANQMKKNLQTARRSARIATSPAEVQRLLKANCSKKAICTIFGLTYQELKELARQK